MKTIVELSKAEVINNLLIWKKWINGTEPSKNKPAEMKEWEKYEPKGKGFAFGTVLYLYLWALRKIGIIFGIPSLTIWASKNSIKHDHLWYEPKSCGYNNSYSDMGLGYLKKGNVEEAVKCLSKSWRVYPCPHNTSYGLKLKLFKKLRDRPEAKEVSDEYLEMWEHFKKA